MTRHFQSGTNRDSFTTTNIFGATAKNTIVVNGSCVEPGGISYPMTQIASGSNRISCIAPETLAAAERSGFGQPGLFLTAERTFSESRITSIPTTNTLVAGYEIICVTSETSDDTDQDLWIQGLPRTARNRDFKCPERDLKYCKQSLKCKARDLKYDARDLRHDEQNLSCPEQDLSHDARDLKCDTRNLTCDPNDLVCRRQDYTCQPRNPVHCSRNHLHCGAGSVGHPAEIFLEGSEGSILPPEAAPNRRFTRSNSLRSTSSGLSRMNR